MRPVSRRIYRHSLVGGAIFRKGSFGMWHYLRSHLSGTPSRQSSGIDPPVEMRRTQGAQMKWFQEPQFSSRVRPVCRGTFWVASRVPSTVSNFKMERGTSLDTLNRERASSCDDGGTTWFFSSCGRILELQPGIQDASYVGSGKTNLPLELRGRAEDCSQVTAGQINLI